VTVINTFWRLSSLNAVYKWRLWCYRCHQRLLLRRNEHLYELTPSHVPLKTTHSSRKLGFLHKSIHRNQHRWRRGDGHNSNRKRELCRWLFLEWQWTVIELWTWKLPNCCHEVSNQFLFVDVTCDKTRNSRYENIANHCFRLFWQLVNVERAGIIVVFFSFFKNGYPPLTLLAHHTKNGSQSFSRMDEKEKLKNSTQIWYRIVCYTILMVPLLMLRPNVYRLMIFIS